MSETHEREESSADVSLRPSDDDHDCALLKRVERLMMIIEVDDRDCSAEACGAPSIFMCVCDFR